MKFPELEVIKILKLDYTIESPEERVKLVEKILEETPNPNEAYLETLTNYIIFAMDKQERKQKKILTDEHMVTVNRRETSYEGLAAQFENGEDGIYTLIDEHNKNTIFKPKRSITKKDIETIPYMKQTREAIELWKARLARATGKNKYIIKKAIIETQQFQYYLKDCYLNPIYSKKITKVECPRDLPEEETVDSDGIVHYSGYSLANPKVCSTILCNYSSLKQNGSGPADGDLYYLMIAFDDICGRALREYPMYETIVQLKIDGYANADIQKELDIRFGITHSPEYISSLWRKKIPSLIASKAEDDILYEHYLNKEKGKYKRCSKCGKIKLAHNKYFSYNKTSKDSFYSICKECRNARAK